MLRLDLAYATMPFLTMKVNSMTKISVDLKVGLAEMLKGGVIMDVINPEQAKIARTVARWR